MNGRFRGDFVPIKAGKSECQNLGGVNVLYYRNWEKMSWDIMALFLVLAITGHFG